MNWSFIRTKTIIISDNIDWGLLRQNNSVFIVQALLTQRTEASAETRAFIKSVTEIETELSVFGILNIDFPPSHFR